MSSFETGKSMLSGTLQRFGVRQCMLCTQSGNFLVPGPELYRLGLLRSLRKGKLWGQPVTAEQDENLVFTPAYQGLVGVVKKNTLNFLDEEYFKLEFCLSSK